MTATDVVSLVRRHRYVAYAVVATVAAVWAYRITLHHDTDWSWFELGARSIVHYRGRPIYAEPSLRVYAENPGLQVGPPPLLMVAATEWLSINTIKLLFSLVMALLGLVALAAVESAAPVRTRLGTVARSSPAVPVVAGVAFAGGWAFEAAAWGHLDDALALGLAALAAAAVARGRAWWLVGILLGTSAAAKPWAIVLAPLLLGLPRVDRARCALVVMAVAGLWWLPFVVGASDTVQALSHTDVIVTRNTVPGLLGLAGTAVQQWIRPVQFALGILVGSAVAVRRPWTAAPLAALAARVFTDPFGFTYYALGPVLFALLWDVTRPGRTRWPGFAAATIAALFVLPALDAPDRVQALARLAWVVGVLVALARTSRASAATSAPGGTGPTGPCRETSHG